MNSNSAKSSYKKTIFTAVTIIVIIIALLVALLVRIRSGIPTSDQRNISKLLCEKALEDKEILKLFEAQQVTLNDINWNWHYGSTTIIFYVDKEDFDPNPIIQQTRNIALQINAVSQTPSITVEFVRGSSGTSTAPFMKGTIKLSSPSSTSPQPESKKVGRIPTIGIG